MDIDLPLIKENYISNLPSATDEMLSDPWLQMFENLQMTEQLYGKHAAALYAQAADFNKTARFYYMKAQDAYYLANAQASYDDWRRARRQWDYFYRRK
mmetsp:Transcript_5805/g.20511  ORF Transcript_5805/g.20511 Transcript_5805/m.20511 type:complete len:98 (+) Transcript_5805:505-798(+)